MSELVKRADLARFFGKSKEEIDRMIKEDGLPAVDLPGPKQEGKRLFLPDVHRWLQSRLPDGSALMRYEVFKQAVMASQPARKPREMDSAA